MELILPFMMMATRLRFTKLPLRIRSTIVSGWTVGQSGRGSPSVTTTDGSNNFIVWVAGVVSDQRLHAYDADTGAVIYAGGGNNEL